MAQISLTKRPVKEFLTFPLRFNAYVKLVGDAVPVGGWIVGYPSSPIPGEEDRWIDHTSFSVGADSSEDFLTRTLSDVGSHTGDAEMARRFLLRNGTLRQWDWHKVDDVLRSGLPDDLKKDIKRVTSRLNSSVYLISVKQFYQEWELLRLLALIAGKLAEKTNPLHVKSDVEVAQKILRELPWNGPQALPRAKGKNAGSRTESVFGEAPAPPRPVEESLAEESLGGARIQASLPKKLRVDITSLYASAFLRGIGSGGFGIAWGPFSEGPRVALNVRSILGVAYLGLLANFSRGWKSCARKDCGNIFRVTDDKRKKFCSQYCGHLVSLRKSREKARIAKRKFQLRNKREKQ